MNKFVNKIINVILKVNDNFNLNKGGLIITFYAYRRYLFTAAAAADRLIRGIFTAASRISRLN